MNKKELTRERIIEIMVKASYKTKVIIQISSIGYDSFWEKVTELLNEENITEVKELGDNKVLRKDWSRYKTMEVGDSFSVQCTPDDLIRVRNNAHSAILRRHGQITTKRTIYGFVVTLAKKPEK